MLTFVAGSLTTLAEARRIRLLRPLSPDELLDFERRTDVYRRSLRPVRGAALVGFVASSILLAFDLSGDQTWAAAAAAAASYAAALIVEWAARRVVIRRPEPFSRYSALPLGLVSWFLRPFIRPIREIQGEAPESPTNGAPAGPVSPFGPRGPVSPFGYSHATSASTIASAPKIMLNFMLLTRYCRPTPTPSTVLPTHTEFPKPS